MLRPRRLIAIIQMEISISKDVLPTLEGYDLEETILGDPKGCIKQYRNSSGLHVREYSDRFVIHRDEVDPRDDPIGHLIRDSPETLLSFGSALFISQRHRNASEDKSSSSINPLFLILALLSLNRIFRAIKRLF
jgi:hypothetical protein